jgi:large subunit ribosomal protein L27e
MESPPVSHRRLIISASRQVVIIQPVDNGKKPHLFGHAIVAGIERYPQKITRRMSKARQERRSKIKPFIKVINYNHLMPTRYNIELEGLKTTVSSDTFKEVSQREDAKKNAKKWFEERYSSGKNRWFFTPLSMFFSLVHALVAGRIAGPLSTFNHGF